MKRSMKNNNVKHMLMTVAVVFVVLLSMTLNSCSGFRVIENGIEEILGDGFDFGIKLPDYNVNGNGERHDGAILDGLKIDGGLDITENPEITDNRTPFTDIVHNVSKSVVEINTETAVYSWGNQYIVQGAGSGVIISNNKDKSVYYIVTNNHVIDGAKKILVRLSDGTEYDGAVLIASDRITDIALIAIGTDAGTELSVATFLNEKSTLVTGQDVFVVGNPLGELGGTVTKGIISKTERLINVDGIAMRLMQTDASVNPGNSGGGMFDMSGNLIGIVNAKYTAESVEGIGFAIPANTVRGVVNHLAKYGYVKGRMWIGVETTDRSYNTGSFFETATTYPTVIADTDASATYKDANGNNIKFTFKKDDIIYAVNGEIVNTTAALMSNLIGYAAKDTVELTVIRYETRVGGYSTQTQYEITVALTEYVQ